MKCHDNTCTAKPSVGERLDFFNFQVTRHLYATMQVTGSKLHATVRSRPATLCPSPYRNTQRNPLRNAVVAKTAELFQNSSSSFSSASKCPFLAGLRTPPRINVPWHRRLQLQLTRPWKIQTEVLQQRGADTVVQLPAAIGFPDHCMPGTAEVVKDVFAAEAAGHVTQGLEDAHGFEAFGTLLGENSVLIVKDHQRHKQLRTLLQPAFSAEGIAAYLPDMQALVGRHLESWQAAGSVGVKGYNRLKAMTFEFILQVVMGRDISQAELLHLNSLFSALCAGLTAWPFLDVPFTRFHKALQARQQLIDYFQAGVNAARQQLAAGQDMPGIMGRLVSAVDIDGSRLSDREICDNLVTLLVAGHDTSSTTLTMCMSNLQDYPAVMDKLREEQRAVQAKRGDQISSAVLKDMVYADAVIRETLRRDPVVSVMVRIATQDLNLAGYAVPSGTALTIPVDYLASTDPRWAEQDGDMHPAMFSPERMLVPEGAKPAFKGGQLMPFGHGMRYCLGAGVAMAEMKVFLALLSRHYSFTADNNTTWKPAIGMYPDNGLPLVLTRN